MLNGRNLEDIIKRKGNEPPCLLLFMYKEQKHFPHCKDDN